MDILDTNSCDTTCRIAADSPIFGVKEMNVSHLVKRRSRLKRRYQLARTNRHGVFLRKYKPLKHTRATRHALAVMVQRMVNQSQRYSLRAYKTRFDEYKIVIEGWPDVVNITVGVYGLSFMAGHWPDFCDFLIFPGCGPCRKNGYWHTSSGISKTLLYKRLEDLLFDKLAQPFLEYLDGVPEKAQLVLCRYENDCTNSQIIELDEKLDGNIQALLSWPLPRGVGVVGKEADLTQERYWG